MQADRYKYFGQYTVMSITQGGCGIPFLAPAVYEYISTGKLSSNIELCLDDVPYPNLQFALRKVRKCYIRDLAKEGGSIPFLRQNIFDVVRKTTSTL